MCQNTKGRVCFAWGRGVNVWLHIRALVLNVNNACERACGKNYICTPKGEAKRESLCYPAPYVLLETVWVSRRKLARPPKKTQTKVCITCCALCITCCAACERGCGACGCWCVLKPKYSTRYPQVIHNHTQAQHTPPTLHSQRVQQHPPHTIRCVIVHISNTIWCV
jgi:hypothetical protein